MLLPQTWRAQPSDFYKIASRVDRDTESEPVALSRRKRVDGCIPPLYLWLPSTGLILPTIHLFVNV